VITRQGMRSTLHLGCRADLHYQVRHPIEPRNFNRNFDRCIIAARVPRITVHSTRKTCVTMETYTEAPSEALRKLSEQPAA
jgi:hypothetical protein